MPVPVIVTSLLVSILPLESIVKIHSDGEAKVSPFAVNVSVSDPEKSNCPVKYLCTSRLISVICLGRLFGRGNRRLLLIAPLSSVSPRVCLTLT